MAGPDVLVVGAGLGGLAAAVGLARAGRQVTVLESHEVVGGYAANFERAPYRFDVSLHLLDAVEQGGANRQIWEHLGLHERVVTACPDVMRVERWPEHELVVHQGMDAWVGALSAAFPGEAGGLRGLSDLAVEVYKSVIADRDARLAGLDPPPLGSPLDGLLDTATTPVLRRFLGDRRAVAIAGSLSCYLGLGCDELAAIPFLAMLASYHAHSGSYAVGGSGAIAAALADTLVSHGGTLRLGAEVTAIRCARRTVVGVTLADGERIDAPVVVANLSPVDLYQRLVSADQVDRRFNARLDHMRLGTSVVKIWLGCRQDPCPTLPYECFLRSDYGTSFVDGTVDDLTVVLPDRLDPGCAPAGGAVVAITAGAEGSLDPADRARHHALAEDAVAAVEARLIPGLRDATEVRVVATPTTFHRYTHNPKGTIHGFRPVPAHSGPRRLGVTGPVDGLYQVGGFTYAGSGFTPAMTSGLVAAAKIAGKLW